MSKKRQKRHRNKQSGRALTEEENPQYVCTIISDEEALKIHSLHHESSSSDSDSGKSSFDEEYFKNQPPPLQINRNQVITIEALEEALQVNNERPEIFEDATTSHQVTKAYRQTPIKKAQTNKPFQINSLNQFSNNVNDVQDIRQVTCEAGPSNHISKLPSNNASTIVNIPKGYQLPYLGKNYIQNRNANVSVIETNETVTPSVTLENEILSHNVNEVKSNRNVAPNVNVQGALSLHSNARDRRTEVGSLISNLNHLPAQSSVSIKNGYSRRNPKRPANTNKEQRLPSTTPKNNSTNRNSLNHAEIWSTETSSVSHTFNNSRTIVRDGRNPVTAQGISDHHSNYNRRGDRSNFNRSVQNSNPVSTQNISERNSVTESDIFIEYESRSCCARFMDFILCSKV